jgi:heterodisulfide reductase subunit C
MNIMINWGYSINKDTSINYDKNDRSVYCSMLKKEPTLGICISCGSCAGTCSVSQFDYFSFRNSILLVQRGEVEALRKEFNKCMFCGKCTLVCPRGVNTRHVLSLLREYLLK